MVITNNQHHQYNQILKKIKKEEPKKYNKEIKLLKLNARNTGFISQYTDPEKVCKIIKPRLFTYETDFKQPHSLNK